MAFAILLRDRIGPDLRFGRTGHGWPSLVRGEFGGEGAVPADRLTRTIFAGPAVPDHRPPKSRPLLSKDSDDRDANAAERPRRTDSANGR
ncbi:Uncharacterised protein [Amycolatopsis camponoti]|uniref:Uncharacterized protein n=1 Tax=Amycolatopsis camponoti TaxID=2606593 RepID=A0A6I8M4T2_9PSEU|nr:Uncharacterised protein [Amycolatopsis camponoti]